MPTVGIIGSYGGLNIGDEAIFTCIVNELRNAVPGVEIVVFSRDPAYTRDHYEVERVIAARQLTREEVKPEVERLDLLLLGGGGILYDEEAHNFLREVRLAQQLGVKTFAFALGAGPLESSETRHIVKETLNNMNGITVRELQSKQLLEEVGVEQDITLTADPALLLTPETFTEEMLVHEGINPERPLVGFSVREPGGAAPGLDESAYHKLLGDAADFVAHRFDADLVFVPMEQVDIRHAHQVIAQMTAAARASVLKGDYTPEQILGLTQRFELAIGMRLHFLIFAAISHVSFLALPYASKVTGFLRALGLPEQNMVQEGRAGPLLATIDQLWDLRRERQAELARKVPELQERARETMRLAAHVLKTDSQNDNDHPQEVR